MSRHQTSCTGCGLDVHDLPYEEFADDEGHALELALDSFFISDDGGDLYCHRCAGSGLGVFL